MRTFAKTPRLSLRAVSGTHVIMSAMNMKEKDCKGLRGFAIRKTDHDSGESYWLKGMRTFAETDPGNSVQTKFSSREHPFQDFLWSDYSVSQNRKYSYEVVALKGAPGDLQTFASTTVTISTEAESDDRHNVFFNRGAASSQEYARRFGNEKPSEFEDGHAVWEWLSRGAIEAILEYIRRAKRGWGLRVCAYEFRLQRVAQELKAAVDRGVDVEILYDASKEFPAVENREVVAKARLKSHCIERVPVPLSIPHNKFIVLTRGKKAVAVLTGSTNFSTGGVFGQSNVVHVVNDPAVADQFLNYWSLLAENPHKTELASTLTESLPLPTKLPVKGTTSVFSPRETADALDYYAFLAGQARHALFMTFPFGMHTSFKDVYRDSSSMLRYALMDKLLGPGVVRPRKKTESASEAKARQAKEREAAEAEMNSIRRQAENRIAVGSTLPLNSFDRWLNEELTGLNQHVQFVHTKFMLVDPLGNDPIVVSGSANFSEASSIKNDENMLIVRGDKRVADIYLTEYIRLWEHYAFREWATAKAKAGTLSEINKDRWHLAADDSWWKRFYGTGKYAGVRQYFGVEVK